MCDSYEAKSLRGNGAAYVSRCTLVAGSLFAFFLFRGFLFSFRSIFLSPPPPREFVVTDASDSAERASSLWRRCGCKCACTCEKFVHEKLGIDSADVNTRLRRQWRARALSCSPTITRREPLKRRYARARLILVVVEK